MRRIIFASFLAAVIALALACRSQDKTTPSPTSTPVSGALTPLPDETPEPTEPATVDGVDLSSLAAQADFPADMTIRQNQAKPLQPLDVPGLTVAASGQFVTVVSEDKNEYVTESVVVPTNGDAEHLLDAFTLKNYLGGLTGRAADATGAALTMAKAPSGAKAFSFTGTVSGVPQQVAGEAVAFVNGRAFVVVVHGRYGASARTIDVASLATTIASRLDSTNLN